MKSIILNRSTQSPSLHPPRPPNADSFVASPTPLCTRLLWLIFAVFGLGIIQGLPPQRKAECGSLLPLTHFTLFPYPTSYYNYNTVVLSFWEINIQSLCYHHLVTIFIGDSFKKLIVFSFPSHLVFPRDNNCHIFHLFKIACTNK